MYQDLNIDKRMHIVTRLVNVETLRFDVEFLLKTYPATWEGSPKYQELKAVVEALKVYNGVAESAIALMTNYNENLTKTKNQNKILYM
jgi:hypothetical protein